MNTKMEDSCLMEAWKAKSGFSNTSREQAGRCDHVTTSSQGEIGLGVDLPLPIGWGEGRGEGRLQR